MLKTVFNITKSFTNLAVGVRALNSHSVYAYMHLNDPIKFLKKVPPFPLTPPLFIPSYASKGDAMSREVG